MNLSALVWQEMQTWHNNVTAREESSRGSEERLRLFFLLRDEAA
uniref:Uncharacterized protein n=1 Tax=Anguilla anguilla TaxID=7936 RepID=A0A0E9S5H8_ANGAN